MTHCNRDTNTYLSPEGRSAPETPSSGQGGGDAANQAITAIGLSAMTCVDANPEYFITLPPESEAEPLTLEGVLAALQPATCFAEDNP